MDTVLGDKALTRKLNHLDRRGAKRAITAGIRAGMTPVAKAMRTAINATDAPTAVKRAARKSIGKRFRRKGRKSQQGAKVGFAVAKKRGKKFSSHGSRGVGIEEGNIHWFVLGTDYRRHENTGQPTGKMPSYFEGVVSQALGASQAASLAAARTKIKQVIDREARRRA